MARQLLLLPFWFPLFGGFLGSLTACGVFLIFFAIDSIFFVASSCRKIASNSCLLSSLFCCGCLLLLLPMFSWSFGLAGDSFLIFLVGLDLVGVVAVIGAAFLSVSGLNNVLYSTSSTACYEKMRGRS